jgi:hypothetical protein
MALASFAAYAEVTPSYPSPGSGATDQPITLALSFNKWTSWYKAEIQVDTVSTFTSKPMWDTVISGASARIAFLKFNKKYYWRARSYSSGDTSVWSTVWSFTTLNKPVLKLPAKGSVTSGFMFWYYAGSPEYLAELDTNANFNSKLLEIFHEKDTLARNYSIDHFEYITTDPGRTYYWRVKAINGKDTSLWSDTWNFRTVTDSLTTPANGAIDVSDRPALNWTRMYPLDSMELQFDTTSTFNSPFAKDLLRLTGYVSPGDTLFKDLYYNTTYYWHIRQIHRGDTTAWRPTNHFTTFASPTPYSPSPGEYFVRLKTALFWQNVDYKNTYEYEYDSTSNFSSPFHKRDTISVDAVITPSLKFEKTYYWRVRAINKNDTSDWSFISTFHTDKRSYAFGGYPYNNLDNQPVKEHFQWGWFNDHVSATVLKLDTSTLFNSKVSRTDTVKTGSPVDYAQTDESSLYYNTRYYWTMKYLYEDDSSYTSQAFTFTTAAKPTLYYPSNTQPNLGVGTNLVTHTIPGSTMHIWQLDTSKNFNSPILRNGFSTSDSTVDPGGNFYFKKKYYWRFREANEVDTSDWSDAWSFGSTDTMYLYAPKKFATGVATNPDLQWGGVIGATGYQYEVGTDPQLKGAKPVTINDGDVADAFVQLHYNTKYYWRMRAFDKNDTSRWSLIWSFTTKAAPVIPTPILLTPINKDTEVAITNGKVSFVWDRNNAAATRYLFEIATDNQFKNIIDSNYVGPSNTSINNLAEATRYYWRVKSYVDTLVSNWSPVFSFKTHNYTSINEPAGVENQITVFPNPSEGLFNIQLPESMNIRELQFLDLSGKRLDIYQNLDHNMAQIDAHQLKPGVYLLRLISGNNVFIKQVILQ